MPRPPTSTTPRALSATSRRTSACTARGIEVGQIFYFGTKYSEPMKAIVAGPDGVERPVHMGSYGIGVYAAGRRDHRSLPRRCRHQMARSGGAVHVAILNLKQGDAATDAASEELYRELCAKGVDVLYHDLDERPGAKFATADLIGVPWQILVGPKGLAEGKVELKCRADGSRELLTPAAAVAKLTQ